METNNSRVKSSVTATFHSRTPLEQEQPNPEVSQTRNNVVSKKMNLFAMALMRLWVPIHEDERQNFIPEYQHDKTRNGVSLLNHSYATPFNQHPAKDMLKYFSLEHPQNLGALTLLNALMSSNLHDAVLGIDKSRLTKQLFFTQRYCTYWHDYHPGTTNTAAVLFDEKNIDQTLIALMQYNNHKTWWDIALDLEDDPDRKLIELYLNEWIETAIRIYVTPIPLLQKIATQILGADPKENIPFLNYFFLKICLFKNSVSRQFENEIQWRNYKNQYAFNVFYRYLRDANVFTIARTRVVETLPPTYIPGLMTVHAVSLKIPNLINYCPFEMMSSLSLDDKINCYSYFIEQTHQELPALLTNPMHLLWGLFDTVAVGFHDKLNQQGFPLVYCPKTALLLHYLLIKSIQFQWHNFAVFILQQNPEFIHQPISSTNECVLPEDKCWGDHSLIFFAQHKKNIPMVDYLNAQGAKLLANEVTPINTAHTPSQAIISPFFKRRNVISTAELIVACEQSYNV